MSKFQFIEVFADSVGRGLAPAGHPVDAIALWAIICCNLTTFGRCDAMHHRREQAPALHTLNFSDGIYFHQHILRQGLHCHAGTGGLGGKILGVHFVKSGKILHIA